ncbi:unnamed protein product, partial [Symbiodinium sp. CCMP2456]
EALDRPLPGLGVRSPISLVFDGITLGSATFARHESLQVICVTSIDAATGRLVNRLLATPSVGSDKDGVSVAKVVLAGLVQHSCGFNEARLRSLPLCMVGGDGANVGGGPRALHSSTRASEKLWDLVYTFGNNSPSNPMVLWDGFHRANTAYEKCVADHQFIAELLACAKAMNASFGVGPGQVVYRSTAAELDIGIKKPEDMGGTRVLIATLNVPANLLNNLQGYVAGLHMKIHRRQRGKGSNTQTSLATIGRRLSSVDFVAFALAVDGVFGK